MVTANKSGTTNAKSSEPATPGHGRRERLGIRTPPVANGCVQGEHERNERERLDEKELEESPEVAAGVNQIDQRVPEVGGRVSLARDGAERQHHRRADGGLEVEPGAPRLRGRGTAEMQEGEVEYDGR